MIPVFDLTRQYKTIKKELNSAFTQTSEVGQFILGRAAQPCRPFKLASIDGNASHP